MGIIAQLRFADPALDLRSRPAADAVRRSRSLHDQGPGRPAGHGKPIQACDQSTTCLQSQIGQVRQLGMW